MMRWCLAAVPGIREKGWHHASLTQFVSPLAAARMLGLDEAQTVAAVGISASSHFTLGGVVAGHLTNMKNTADPLATEAGVRAALLAAENYTGPEEIVEGKEGLFEVMNQVDWSADILLSDLGERFLITECGYKAFPTEALTHQPITAVIRAMSKNGLSGEDIERIEIRTTTRGADILSDPSKYKPKTKETADHSLPYCIAVAAVDGNVLPASFDEQKLNDPKIASMLERIEVTADPEIDALFPRVKRAIATVTTTDGRHFTEQVDHAKGSAQNPMSDEDVIAKFRSNAERTIKARRQQEIIEATMEFGVREEETGRFMSRLTG
jgi:2-methylcitrate dehydratase